MCIYMALLVLLTLVFNQESHSGTSTFNLEEIVQSPSPEIQLHFYIILCVLAKHF